MPAAKIGVGGRGAAWSAMAGLLFQGAAGALLWELAFLDPAQRRFKAERQLQIGPLGSDHCATTRCNAEDGFLL
jgi:hypothetical protein